MTESGPILARGRPIRPGAGPFLCGILNCTPDSFSDGGRHDKPADAIAAAMHMAEDGADWIDVGGESTRPGSEPVSDEEQIHRTREVIATLARAWGTDGPVLSIDTQSARVAQAALEAGATIVNDVSAMRDPAMTEVIARAGAGVVLMHMQGTPATMQDDPTYEDVTGEVAAFLEERRDAAIAAGIRADRIMVDPGIGFGKTLAHNLDLLANVDAFRSLGCPVMIGTSRKGFIARIAGDSVEQRLWGTLATVAHCVAAGVEVLRVHDVAACRAVAAVVCELREYRLPW